MSNSLSKLIERYNSLLGEANLDVFHQKLIYFWKFIADDPLCNGIVTLLLQKFPEAEQVASEIENRQQCRLAVDETFGAAISVWLVKKAASLPRSTIEYNVGIVYAAQTGTSKIPSEAFRKFFIDPIERYVREHLVDGDAFLYWMGRYLRIPLMIATHSSHGCHPRSEATLASSVF